MPPAGKKCVIIVELKCLIIVIYFIFLLYSELPSIISEIEKRELNFKSFSFQGLYLWFNRVEEPWPKLWFMVFNMREKCEEKMGRSSGGQKMFQHSPLKKKNSFVKEVIRWRNSFEKNW